MKAIMPKIVFIGGGSAKFVRELTVDLFSFPELAGSHIALMDIDSERVERSERIVRKIIQERKLPATVSSTLDRKRALEGADYVIITIMVGGMKYYHSDTAIPLKYGVMQAVADTSGVGGVFRYLRTAPVLARIVRDLAEVSPKAWILNYANPMAMNTWSLLAAGHSRSVGLCHSIQFSKRDIARWLNLPPEEIDVTAGGINHVDFFLTLERRGKDIYPLFKQNAERIVAAHPHETVRFELLEYLGYWPAEGPWHQSEYYPWFRKDQQRVEHYRVETAWGYNFDSQHNTDRIREVEQQLAGTIPIRYERSDEYGAPIMHALESRLPFMFYGNLKNDGLIANLPSEAVVEVPCTAGEGGIVPGRVGRIPPELAAVMQPHIAVHELAVAAAFTLDRRLARLAVQADPLVGAILTMPQIGELFDEMWQQNAEYLIDWKR
jgi:alpha-galactosidase